MMQKNNVKIQEIAKGFYSQTVKIQQPIIYVMMPQNSSQIRWNRHVFMKDIKLVRQTSDLYFNMRCKGIILRNNYVDDHEHL